MEAAEVVGVVEGHVEAAEGPSVRHQGERDDGEHGRRRVSEDVPHGAPGELKGKAGGRVGGGAGAFRTTPGAAAAACSGREGSNHIARDACVGSD
jgi:hypothetical protein